MAADDKNAFVYFVKNVRRKKKGRKTKKEEKNKIKKKNKIRKKQTKKNMLARGREKQQFCQVD